MATKLGLYNGALREMGERRLDTLTERGESRRVLDDVYDDVIEDCLAAGSWNFATETVKLDADTGVAPNFGFDEVFAKPSDWVRTHAISSNEDFATPLMNYYDDGDIFSANVTPIYVRYVSNDTGQGLFLDRWPRSFTRYVELELAARSARRLTQGKGDLDDIRKERDRARLNALNNDAMNEPNPKFPPAGSWTVSRQSRHNTRDLRKRSSLTG